MAFCFTLSKIILLAFATILNKKAAHKNAAFKNFKNSEIKDANFPYDEDEQNKIKYIK